MRLEVGFTGPLEILCDGVKAGGIVRVLEVAKSEVLS
jgi:hypothetical protein